MKTTQELYDDMTYSWSQAKKDQYVYRYTDFAGIKDALIHMMHPDYAAYLETQRKEG